METLSSLKLWQKIVLSSAVLGLLLLAYGIWYLQARNAREPSKLAFQEHCASCHGDNLQGQPKWKTSLDEDGHNYAPPLNGTGHTWHHSEEQLYNIIRYGLKFYNENYEGKMQGNDKLSDEDVWSILAYIKSVWPESIQKKYKTMTKH